METKFIVLTGGPGAGKTAILELIKHLLSKDICVLAESAGILFDGGFPRLSNNKAMLATQKAIFSIQEQMEEAISGEKSWKYALCDRGTLDGLAYWIEDEASFYRNFNTNPKEQFQRYLAVIHLRTPTLEQGYNNSNPNRIETVQQALAIDEKIKKIWSPHASYYEIPSGIDFSEKVKKTLSIINGLVFS
ncbi:MAG: ATP-binding protein [Bacteriovoracaceae bacterium]|jgi:thymidylate kinase|nr:ATP-binding protein [Bacteriovoracaceae bacterium]